MGFHRLITEAETRDVLLTICIVGRAICADLDFWVLPVVAIVAIAGTHALTDVDSG
jgi:hypothetical protein